MDKKDQMSLNFNYVKENHDKLINLYQHKYILVFEQQVVGSFDTYDAAAEEGISTYGLEGNFLVYYVTEDVPVNFISTALI